MKIYNLPNKEKAEDSAKTFHLRDKLENKQENLHPIYNEVLKIFRHAFEYIDISKIFKNL